ncbi:MAG: OmpA family protein [Gemmatimonadetes bacterium]|nr:OmpA family protein [Gemmatimonadota bacterium]
MRFYRLIPALLFAAALIPLSAGAALAQDEGDENAGAPGEGVWRNYDFVPGSTVWFATDFTDEPVGRFPASQLEFVKGNMQIVEMEGEKVLEASTNSTFRVMLPEALPEDFTVELILKTGTPNMATYVTFTPREAGWNRFEGHYLALNRYPGIYAGGQDVATMALSRGLADEWHDVKFQQDGTYAIAYVDSDRVSNLPNANFVTGTTIDIDLAANARFPTYIKDIVVSVGLDKLYDALMESGEFTTRGILFAFDSDALLPESTPVLTDMVSTLENHPELAIVIEGHTDSVGDDAYNLDLSERRAGSVVAYLVENGIDAGRLLADGKGESEPVADNATPEGRQQNRRVVVRLQE